MSILFSAIMSLSYCSYPQLVGVSMVDLEATMLSHHWRVSLSGAGWDPDGRWVSCVVSWGSGGFSWLSSSAVDGVWILELE